MRTIKVAVYGDVNLNLIDGSAVWLGSLAETLRLGADVHVTLLLKAVEERDVISARLRGLTRLDVVAPPQGQRRLRPEQALDALEALDAERGFDVIVLRGFALCRAAADRDRLAGRLWVYLTDIPQRVDDLDDTTRAELAAVVDASARVLCQTEELRDFLEAVVPAVGNRTSLLPPMIPPDFAEAGAARPDPVTGTETGTGTDPGTGTGTGTAERPPRLFYAGKFAPRWGFLELVEAFAAVRAEIGDAELHVAGDKIHDPPEDPDYAPAVRAALASTPGLVWHGGVTREQVAGLLAAMDVAVSVRHPDLDDSLELSTKILEYGAAGVAVVLNRTPAHVALYGADYPLFTGGFDELAETLRDALGDDARRATAQARCRATSERFTFERVHAGLAPLLRRAAPDPPAVQIGNGRATRVGVAGHDLKFFADVEAWLRAAGAETRVDHWANHDTHDEAVSAELADWADVIVCEWALGNAVWYSRNRRAGQRLIVRLHRMEVDTDYPLAIDIDAVDQVVFVGPAQRDVALARFGWPQAKATVLPNAVDVLAMDRPKLDDAAFHLGMLGYVSTRKRLDLALDLLEALRLRDRRFHLSLKGRFPWEVSWVWHRLAERADFERQVERIGRAPLLREAVSFDGFGPVAPWLRKIGFILSLSDDESFHVACAEGMAARCVPVLRPWRGAAQLYPQRAIHDDVDDAAAAVLATVGGDTWVAEGEAARAHVSDTFDTLTCQRAWLDLLLAVTP